MCGHVGEWGTDGYIRNLGLTDQTLLKGEPLILPQVSSALARNPPHIVEGEGRNEGQECCHANIQTNLRCHPQTSTGSHLATITLLEPPPCPAVISPVPQYGSQKSVVSAHQTDLPSCASPPEPKPSVWGSCTLGPYTVSVNQGYSTPCSILGPRTEPSPSPHPTTSTKRVLGWCVLCPQPWQRQSLWLVCTPPLA